MRGDTNVSILGALGMEVFVGVMVAAGFAGVPFTEALGGGTVEAGMARAGVQGASVDGKLDMYANSPFHSQE